MSPQLRKRSKIVLALEDIYAKPNYHFPDVYMKKARQLYERWEASGWKDEREGDGAYDDQTHEQPSRLALFQGAHGHQQAGICGDEKSGAFSIVVSGQYELLDTDRGTYLYYSGSGSVDNTDPRQPAPSTTATMALHTSLGNGCPVRVLRSSTGKSRYAPSFGMRYDGLYTVVSVSYPSNSKGGMYEQFKLERNNGQTDIDMLVHSPSPVEIGQYQQINRVNTATWSRSSDHDSAMEE
ncbi:hypothetical protein BTJ68_10785 [Hortaea werneckii EXF-2000]|uniref:YDG domain-containing protein n=1 Tax=Hortaea werneckii EXF-2000 TaxID=1157616 RepID=A0A1Z5SZM2_HORWE|nr:hypothetical protein BTJ68_10785 [Hortaea werneckii EXF-2000]